MTIENDREIAEAESRACHKALQNFPQRVGNYEQTEVGSRAITYIGAGCKPCKAIDPAYASLAGHRCCSDCTGRAQDCADRRVQFWSEIASLPGDDALWSQYEARRKAQVEAVLGFSPSTTRDWFVVLRKNGPHLDKRLVAEAAGGWGSHAYTKDPVVVAIATITGDSNLHHAASYAAIGLVPELTALEAREFVALLTTHGVPAFEYNYSETPDWAKHDLERLLASKTKRSKE